MVLLDSFYIRTQIRYKFCMKSTTVELEEKKSVRLFVTEDDLRAIAR